MDRTLLFRWACVIFSVSFGVRLAIIVATQSYLTMETSETIRIAQSLANTGAFADAYGEGSGPTAHTSPLYPLLLSAVMRFAGYNITQNFLQQAISSAFASLQYALLPLLAAEAGLPLAVGWLGGLLGGLLPVARWVQMQGAFEYSLAALLLVGFLILQFRVWRTQTYSARSGALLGLLFGLNLLTSPTAGPLICALGMYGLIFVAQQRRLYARLLVCQCLVAAAVVSPWVLRNYLVLGAPIVSRSNLGLELELSNNSRSSPLWEENKQRGLFAIYHPIESARTRQRIRELGEVAHNQERLQAASNWIRQNKLRFASDTLQRAWYFWFPVMNSKWQTLAIALMTAGAFAGMVWGLASRIPGFRYLLLIWVIYPAPVLVFQSSIRLRYPIDWSVFMMFAYALVQAAVSIRYATRAYAVSLEKE